jgi:hypothetical protein
MQQHANPYSAPLISLHAASCTHVARVETHTYDGENVLAATGMHLMQVHFFRRKTSNVG